MKKCPGCGLLYPDESTFCFLDGQTLQANDDQLVGSTVAGRFRVEELVRETPWARSYRARHRLLQRPCVLKLLNTRLEGAGRDAFVEALSLARRCSHPNVAELTCGGITDDGVPYAAQPTADGELLAKVLSGPRLPVARAAGVVLQLCGALGRIHDFGGVHGNLRPTNVFYWPNGHVEVGDVGLGRSLVREPWDEDPASLGAQRYFAPELSSNRRSSPTADLYAAGVIACQLLAGQLPFQVDTVRELRAALADESWPSLASTLPGIGDQLGERLVAWLERMLARFENQRPDNAHQAIAELEEACAAAGVSPAADPGRPGLTGGQAELDGGFARWQRYLGVFQRMLQQVFPAGAPPGPRDAFEQIQGRVERLAQVGKRALYEHGSLDDVLGRARESRLRIAEQMAELNASAQEVRRELSPLRIAAERHGEKAVAFPGLALEMHREVVQWEGRSGFTEPYRELAGAYRQLAELVDKWWSVRHAQLACEKDAATKEEVLRGLETQLDELRRALRVNESNVATELEGCEQGLAELGREADRLELELLDLASRFSAPLRSKPELGPAFRELAAG